MFPEFPGIGENDSLACLGSLYNSVVAPVSTNQHSEKFRLGGAGKIRSYL